MIYSFVIVRHVFASLSDNLEWNDANNISIRVVSKHDKIFLLQDWTEMLSAIIKLYSTNFCTQFRITLKSMRSQCHGQRKSLNVQLNSWENRIVHEIVYCQGQLFLMKTSVFAFVCLMFVTVVYVSIQDHFIFQGMERYLLHWNVSRLFENCD